MEGSVADLSRYRLARAKEDLDTAKKNCVDGSFRASVNRSYYAIFHSLRAITALDRFDSGKHSGIIAFINMHYVKTGVFERSFSKMIDTAFRLRKRQIMTIFMSLLRLMPKNRLPRRKRSFSS